MQHRPPESWWAEFAAPGAGKSAHVQLGPFGGGRGGGVGLLAWTVVYLAALAALAVWGFRRRDL